MFSAERSLSAEKNFSSSDLLQYIETLMKESKIQQSRNSTTSNYSWLKSRNLIEESDPGLDRFNNIVLKLTSESCAAIAVKLDRLADESVMSPRDIMSAFSKLLEEQETIQILEEKVKLAKQKKISKLNLGFKDERRSSLSFIFK